MLDNLVAGITQSWRGFLRRRSSAADRERAYDVLREFRFEALAERQAGELSFGQRKLLQFGTTLMSRPKLVLLDEPTSGVNPLMVETMERHIRALHAADPVRRGRDAAPVPAREIHGTVHLYTGQEAVAIGVCGALQSGDLVAATYRGHGAALAQGTSPEAVASATRVPSASRSSATAPPTTGTSTSA